MTITDKDNEIIDETLELSHECKIIYEKLEKVTDLANEIRKIIIKSELDSAVDIMICMSMVICLLAKNTNRPKDFIDYLHNLNVGEFNNNINKQN